MILADDLEKILLSTGVNIDIVGDNVYHCEIGNTFITWSTEGGVVSDIDMAILVKPVSIDEIVQRIAAGVSH